MKQTLYHLEDVSVFCQYLAKQLQAGDVIALNGPMGAGKTTLTQHLARHLGCNETITSPTFVLIHEYHSGRCPLIHVDLYRLGPENAESLAPELLEWITSKNGIMIIEWADYGEFLNPYLTLRLTITLENEDRVIYLEEQNQRQPLKDV